MTNSTSGDMGSGSGSAQATGKSEGAFLTIGELADELGLPQHILRYWETRFPQLKPLQRAGNRRYYRPADAALAREISRLLYQEGYTVKGVQKLLSVPTTKAARETVPQTSSPVIGETQRATAATPDIRPALLAIKTRLERALVASRYDG
jgi:DNA-binding transcriptional MerR regulator